jgi:alcohol dehydrogenase
MDGPDLDALRKFVAPEIVYGCGARHLAGHYAANLRMRRPLVVSGRVVAGAGWTGDVLASLERAQVPYTVLLEVSPNPTDTDVEAGLRAYQSAGCDSLIAVGGGSPMDCAKAIGVVVSNGGAIGDFEGVDHMRHPCPPLICVPTTAGTGADVSQFAIIRDAERGTKMAIIGKALVPDVSLTDPETTLTMDPYLTACTGMDALCHAVEAAASNARSALADVHAFHATALALAHLEATVADGARIALRKAMAQASLHAGLAFSNASLGAVHAMAHALGGKHDLPHGECNAVLLPHVVAHNARRAPRCYEPLGRYLAGLLPDLGTGATGEGLAEAIARLAAAIGAPSGLRALGVSEAEIDGFAELACADPCLLTNPWSPSREDLVRIYADAL